MRCCFFVITTLLLLPLTVQGADEVSVRLLASNLSPYVGEELALTLELLAPPRPTAPLSAIFPIPNGFSGEELPLAPPRREGSLLLQSLGKTIRPLLPGEQRLSGLGVRVGDAILLAEPLTLRVQPLPLTGRPDGFTGIVGDLDMTLMADGVGNREIVLTLCGTAPLATFPAPTPHLPQGERLLFLGSDLQGSAPGERVLRRRYLYLPGDGERGGLTFSLTLFSPRLQSYQRLKVGQSYKAPALPSAQILPLLNGAALLGIILVTWQRWRHQSLRATLTYLLRPGWERQSRDESYRQLSERGVPPKHLTSLSKLWQKQDQARFAPQKGSPPTSREERELARSLRKAVDKRRRIP
ncbi:MAG: hypothetical protein C0621_02975 [Desulfuromonas sp.]|nr:MAG: hypothetical protein C0621_02975 [Desulfuromonas sp.]